MITLEASEILSNIENERTFSCTSFDNSFFIEINKYQPFVCAAIHHGANLRESLKNKCALTDIQRWKEEDPLTGDFISSMPIRIVAKDSRYEYDLNRKPDACVYEDKAWGQTVWKEKLSEDDLRVSREKHAFFYKILDALLTKIIQKFSKCVVYDIHSYNFKRIGEDAPVFNIGTEQLSRRYRNQIQEWLSQLLKIKLPDIVNTTEENKVFFGRGYLAHHVCARSEDILVLPTEIKKIYCNENSGEKYLDVIDALTIGLGTAILNHSRMFADS